MDNPLTPEQLAKLNALAKLPPEEQQQQLPAFLKTLTPEQLAYLKQQQGQTSCLFCSIAAGKIKSHVLYQDDQFMAVLDIHPATSGHTLLFPKQHYSILEQLSDNQTAHFFTLSSRIMGLLHKTLSAAGINLFFAQGAAAGQAIDHLLIHLIPRYTNDDLPFRWDGKETSEQELGSLQEKLSPLLSFREKTVAEQQPLETDISPDDEERIPDF